MVTATDRLSPQLDGWHFGEIYKQGTGGHGDTAEAYSETYNLVVSMVSVSEKLNTGKRIEKLNPKTSKLESKPVYYVRKYRKKRVEKLIDVIDYSLSVVNEFKKVGLHDGSDINCYNLMKWQKDKNDNDIEVAKGFSFKSGDYEARLINGKHAFLFKSKVVRSFAGKS